MTGGRRKLRARQFMIGTVGKAGYSMHGEQRNIQILVGKPEERRQHGSPRRRWEVILITDVDRINLARERDKRQADVNTVMNIWVQ